MTDLIKRIDPASFPLLGLLGAFACGPVGPSQGESGTGTGTDTDPTGTSDPTDPTSPTTTMPPTPECEDDSDCEETYCGYCFEGRCQESVGCCGVHGAEQMEDGKWRCSPPYYGCDYGDEICADGYVCEFNECVLAQIPVIPLPECRSLDLETKTWNLGDGVSALVLADVDGDADLDIVVTHPEAGVLELGLNDGAGDFTSGGTIDVGVAPTMALAAGDIDGDGDPDLAVLRGGQAGVLRLVFNDGAMFTAGEELQGGELPTAVHLADLNGDKALDVVTIEAQAVTVQFGDGLGGLGSSLGFVEPFSALAGVVDVSGDDIADLLLPLTLGPEIKTRLGQTEGGLGDSRTFVPFSAAGAPMAADLDLQGASDVVVVQPDGGAGMIEVWLASSPGEWAATQTRFASNAPLHGGRLAELDANPGPDLVAVTGADQVAIVPGDGKGGFVCAHLQRTSGATSASLLAVGDVDGDGKQDIVVGGESTTIVDIVLLK